MSRYEPVPDETDPWDRTTPEIDVSRPHAARMYDYYLGGKDHFEADRVTAEKGLESWAAVRTGVRENRAFLGRAVRYLVEEAGIRQFLDIGTGLPSANNVHEVAQSVAPESRVVYVDNDPIVLAHAKALLTSTPEGRAAFIHAEDFVQLVFDGLEIVEPGIEVVSEWRPEATGPRPTAIEVSNYGGVARKP